MAYHPGGTEMLSHRKRHWLVVATKRRKIELVQREIKGKGITDKGNGVPTPENQNMNAIVSEEMKGKQETVTRGEQRCGERRW